MSMSLVRCLSPHMMEGPPSPPQTEAPARREIEFDLSQMQPWRECAVVLYDDDIHTQMEVVLQLVKALNCPFPRAHELMRTAEEHGKVTVAITHRERALEIAGVLRQIQLRVTLRQTN
ncbi:MAG TPA: ATP-dependent Clp protease adaptor ClpS [Sumerlaeia bacterium]|nr:ATP-dependent Clp protease adaptor ClpS [Sumerlaeia bacterium]